LPFDVPAGEEAVVAVGAGVSVAGGGAVITGVSVGDGRVGESGVISCPPHALRDRTTANNILIKSLRLMVFLQKLLLH